jgi:membrane-associated phospholipid phosphatase
MATFVIVGLVFGWGYSLIVVPFVISVCWVRLYLKRHTPAQVVAGLGLGVLTSVLSLTLLGCF